MVIYNVKKVTMVWYALECECASFISLTECLPAQWIVCILPGTECLIKTKQTYVCSKHTLKRKFPDVQSLCGALSVITCIGHQATLSVSSMTVADDKSLHYMTFYKGFTGLCNLSMPNITVANFIHKNISKVMI